jgi:hypothetical protein
LSWLALVCLLAATHLPFAAEEHGTGTPRLVIGAVAAGKFPVGTLGERWKPYATGGILLELPTGLGRLSARFGLDAGVLTSSDGTDRELLALEFHAAASYALMPADRLFDVRPTVGITSTAVFRSRSFELEADIFRSSESEFGFVAGVEPLLRIRRFRFGLPLKATCVLSAPHIFAHVGVGCTLSREF